MARFLNQYYAGDSVAVNDIGVVSLAANVRMTDLVGLADMEMARVYRSAAPPPQYLERLARDRHLACVVAYPKVINFLGGTPETWVEVGSWEILENMVCDGPKVVFYAPGPIEAKRLRDHLRAFAPRLPPTVIGRIF